MSTVFARRLKELREQRGLSQTQLAKTVRTSQRLISNYETSTAQPTVGVLTRLARALEASVDEVLGLKRPALVHIPKNHTLLWKKFRKLASLPLRDQRAVFRIISNAVRLSTLNGRGASKSHAIPSE